MSRDSICKLVKALNRFKKKMPKIKMVSELRGLIYLYISGTTRRVECNCLTNVADVDCKSFAMLETSLGRGRITRAEIVNRKFEDTALFVEQKECYKIGGLNHWGHYREA